MFVLMNKGDGTFAPRSDMPAGNGAYYGAAADLNGDGRVDVVVPNSLDNTISVFFGQTQAVGEVYTIAAESPVVASFGGLVKTYLAIGLGRKVVERGHTGRFTTATALLSTLAKAESEGILAEKLTEFTKPRLLITTNQRVSEWGTVFGDEVLATAILDRLLHHSHTLMITGESYRLREKRKSGLFRSGVTAVGPEPEKRPSEDGRERDRKGP